MSHAIEFIETSIFTKQINAMANDDELKVLQSELIAQPEKGDLISGTGGLRKIRMASGGKGKSGSIRVIYFLATADIIYLVLAYAKNVKDTLSQAEKYELKASLEEAIEIRQGNKPPSRLTRYEVADVKALRAKLDVSQQELADALGTSVDTIKSWENKRRNPTGLAAKVLATIQDNPNYFHDLAAH